MGLNDCVRLAAEVPPHKESEIVVVLELVAEHHVVLKDELPTKGLQCHPQISDVARLRVRKDKPRRVGVVLRNLAVDRAGRGAGFVGAQPVATPDVDRAVRTAHVVSKQHLSGSGPNPRRDLDLQAGVLHDPVVSESLVPLVDEVDTLVAALKEVLVTALKRVYRAERPAPVEVHDVVEGVAAVRAQIEVPIPRLGETHGVGVGQPVRHSAPPTPDVHRGVVEPAERCEGSEVELQAI
mmetsp:Transcript_64309/g.199120  ORF Transcript_64309/g.199120 Transcript_64309/m.199120 type:complete len:238 (+) Transcript_64309:254-967(+)